MQHIALINHSTYFASKVNVVRSIATTINTQLSRHVCHSWGALIWSCVYYTSEAHAPANAYNLFLFDNADQAGALGYHDQDPNGKPYGRVFVKTILDYGGTELNGSLSVSAVTSHEALEIFGDAQVGLWDVMPDGRLTAHELCDAVENDSYIINGVSVSNFLLPGWFDINPEVQQFDNMALLSAPFTMTPGGYMIVMKSGQVSQVFGDKPMVNANFAADKRNMKNLPGSRTARRLAISKKA